MSDRPSLAEALAKYPRADHGMALIGLGYIEPSTYNPRTAVSERLDLIELSLRKLGFVLPLYATADGEILSGHQRHLVAKRLGDDELLLPVTTTRKMHLEERKTVNVIFNRATNDMDSNETPTEISRQLEAIDPWSFADKLPDIEPGSDAFYPCLEARAVPTGELTIVNDADFIDYAFNIGRLMAQRGISMPLVCRPDLKVINGIGRLQAAASRSEESCTVVFTDYEQAEFAAAMLNKLSMNFDLTTRYADFLRHNSFRRGQAAAGQTRWGYGFTMFIEPGKDPQKVTLDDAATKRKFERLHGKVLLDFGAGRHKETYYLRECGFDVTAFEPYFVSEGDQISHEESVARALIFLEDIANGKRFHSIFLSAIMNSVPFYEDRVHIVTILSAIAKSSYPRTAVYASANSANHSSWKGIDGKVVMNRNIRRTAAFKVEYEEGTKLGGMHLNNPKIQKYHTAREFKELFETGFHRSKSGYYKSGVAKTVAWRARRVDRDKLIAALEHEFDLPYPGGLRMGLVDEAKAAFGKRLKMDLS